MASSSLTFPFEKLRVRENFDVWKRHAKSYLVIRHCWKIIETGISANPNDKELKLNERALVEITLMVEPSNFAHIATCAAAKDAWTALVSAYGDSGITRKVELLKQLVQLKLTDCESMQEYEYINTMSLTSLKVQNAGLNIDDELKASLMLAGPPDDFRVLVLAVENSKTELTVDVVKNLLLQDVKFDNKTYDSALYTNKKANPARYLCRINRTLIERVRCMLLDSGLTNKFWAEAATTADFLMNIVRCRDNDYSPEEIWSRRKPDLNRLRIFGCKAMVHVPKEKRTKLDEKSMECI